MRRFKVTYRSNLIETQKEHVCEGLLHSDGQVYLRGYTGEDLFKSMQHMVSAVALPQDYAFLSIEWIDGKQGGESVEHAKASIENGPQQDIFRIKDSSDARNFIAHLAWDDTKAGYFCKSESPETDRCIASGFLWREFTNEIIEHIRAH